MIEVVQYFQNLIAATIVVSQQQYYTWNSEKLMDYRIIPKTYWSFWKHF